MSLFGNLHNSLSQSARKIAYHYYSWTFRYRKPPLKLFVLGHMRSGSSLLTHILNTNPEILGFGETSIKYSSEEDFYKLISTVHFTVRQFRVQEQYILDKLLHDRYLLNLDMLKADDLFSIFIIREPRSTIASIVKLLPQFFNEDKALDYYINRLQSLEKYAKYINNKKHNLLITYDQLLNQSNSVLIALEDFLNIQHSFSENYQILRTTGRRHIGDSSDNIQAGKILRNKPTPEIKLMPNVIRKGTQAFNQCYKSLSEYCLEVELE